MLTQNLLDGLLDGPVAAVELGADAEVPAPLREEEAAVSRAVPRRQREFAVGRYCARQALALAGGPLAPIASGPLREPVWPDGFVGSITHCPVWCAAAVASACHAPRPVSTSKPTARLPPNVRPVVASRRELEHIARLPLGVAWDAVLFSAKESVFKAWFR
jgi:4'-phosphopantetheinyl transferase EntD